MGSTPKYKKKDFKRVSLGEYEKTLKILYQKVKEYLDKNSVKIDAVVPIMRGGAFPGVYLAYKLGVLAVLPIQYKYSFEGSKARLKRLTDYPENHFDLPQNPTFLLVEGNHCFGNTAQVAVKDLKEKFPGCKIIYAVDHEDASFQKLEGVEENFYGKLTDETRALAEEEAERLGVERDVSYLLPWEELEEEWTTVQGKQYKYHDRGSRINGETKMELNLGDEYL